MPKKSDTNAIKKFTALLPCRLTDTELKERGTELALQRKAAEDWKEEAKAARAELKKKADELDSRISQLAKTVREKSEVREISCEVRPSRRSGYADEVRIDTEEVLRSRSMKDDERQRDLAGFGVTGMEDGDVEGEA